MPTRDTNDTASSDARRRRRSRTRVRALWCLVLAGGCAGDHQMRVPPAESTGEREVVVIPPATLSDTLRLEVQVAAEVRQGDAVPIVLRLVNISARTIEVHLQGRETVFDLIVREAEGGIVWRRLEGETAMAILALRPLAPGAAFEFRHVWDQRDRAGRPVPPGRYHVTGEVPYDAVEPLRSPPATLVVAR